MDKPIIAITGPQRGAFGPRLMVALAIRFYGGYPKQIRPADVNHRYEYDGVVITGGHDIEPVLYASKPEVEPNYDTDRDKLEMDIIQNALARGVPLLGICRGAQLLNICRGGSLFQELRSRRKKTSNRWTILPLKTLCIVDDAGTKDSRLRSLFRAKQCRINSLHNQGIDRIGDGLTVTGRDLDGIVQAVEDTSADFLVGVQWHPEFLPYLSRHRALFHELVKKARVQKCI